MNPSISSLVEFDQALFAQYARFVEIMPGQPMADVQKRFAQYGVFPKLGWALIGTGEAQALAANDPAVLYDTITRFVQCAHACWGNPDADGIHWGGYDYCSIVTHSLYSALLGRTYLSTAFRCNRPISKNGYGAYKHAANLMVCLECGTWKHREKAIEQAQSFVAAKRTSKAEKAFISFFLAVLADDTPQVLLAVIEFADGYLTSDWGRHKPLTKPTFVQAMLVFARLYLTTPVDEQAHRTLISNDRFALWQEYDRRLAEFLLTPHQFSGPLDFLNDLATVEICV